ncbi:uncharacterized protein LOC132193781 [Neocloeon triangulifer]|uniref:uncharacterized protein LOC132193781 n=1 Tax=Neocloeon triangulifer TaxID=2078957 RepID=UPI00286FA756|nr:uncharacterized protein LOC132193781 [Neocloeon triangulifer]
MLVTAFLLWGCLHAVVAAPEVELITEPRPGEEYVHFKASLGPSGRNLNVFVNNATTAAPLTTNTEQETTGPTTFQTDAIANTDAPKETVEVQTEVSVVISKEMHINGRIIKQEQHKKMENVQIVPSNADKFETSHNREHAASEVVEFKSEAEIGLLNRPTFEGKRGDSFTVPAGKFQSIDKSQHTAAVAHLTDLPPFNILSSGSRKPSEGHDIIAKGSSSHLPLETAGSQTQSSRVNVKKAPNGQEYEYEYIYYYDDEENPEGESVDLEEDLTKPVELSSTTTTTTTTTAAPTTAGYRNRYLPTEAIPEDIPSKKEEGRYTTINRGRGQHRAEPVEYQTEVPFVNEINAPVRHSGRQFATSAPEEPEEERLPVVTRFPPRAIPGVEPNAPGRVRPSLELVDSNSFRTGAAAPADSTSGGNRFTAEAEETFVPPAKTRVRSTTTTTTSTTTTTTTAAPEVPATDPPSTDRPHKAAYDLAALYATIQNADDQRANEVIEPAQNDEITTQQIEEELTTLPVTEALPSSTTTTTTTTTEAPSTTEGRTRGRIRPGAGSSIRKQPGHLDRSRARKPVVAEATSTAAPETKTRESNKLLSTRNRPRQRGYASSLSTTAPSEEEVVKDSASPVANAAPSFASKTRTNSIKNAIQRPSFPRRRGPPSRTTTAAPAEAGEEAHVEGEPINVELQPSVSTTSTSTTQKPRILANRPRSPLLLRNRNRPGQVQSTTAAPASSEQANEEVPAPEVAAETSAEAAQPPQDESSQAQNATTAAPTGLNRLRKRPNLLVTEKPRKASPVQQSPVSRRQLLARPRRPSPLAATTAEPKASTESEVGATNSEEEPSQEAEAAPVAATTASTAAPEPQTTESLVSSLIKKRAGRKPGPHFRARSAPSE